MQVTYDQIKDFIKIVSSCFYNPKYFNGLFTIASYKDLEAWAQGITNKAIGTYNSINPIINGYNQNINNPGIYFLGDTSKSTDTFINGIVNGTNDNEVTDFVQKIFKDLDLIDNNKIINNGTEAILTIMYASRFISSFIAITYMCRIISQLMEKRGKDLINKNIKHIKISVDSILSATNFTTGLTFELDFKESKRFNIGVTVIIPEYILKETILKYFDEGYKDNLAAMTKDIFTGTLRVINLVGISHFPACHVGGNPLNIFEQQEQKLFNDIFNNL